MLKLILPDATLDHTAIAVHSIADYVKSLGLPFSSDEIETLPQHGVSVYFIPLHSGNIEIISPYSPESQLNAFIQKRGTALHHIGLKVKDIQHSLELLRQGGFHLIDKTPRIGARKKQIAFIHPQSTGGILYELCADPS